jgi:hypothetical protein
MLNTTTPLAEALGRHLAETYERTYGGREPEYARLLESAGKLVIEWIANSDALYPAPTIPLSRPSSGKTFFAAAC